MNYVRSLGAMLTLETQMQDEMLARIWDDLTLNTIYVAISSKKPFIGFVYQ